MSEHIIAKLLVNYWILSKSIIVAIAAARLAPITTGCGLLLEDDSSSSGKVWFRCSIHPCEKGTTGGCFACISAIARSINICAETSPSWWTILSMMPVLLSKQVNWGVYKLLCSLQWSLHAESNHSHGEFTNCLNNSLFYLTKSKHFMDISL